MKAKKEKKGFFLTRWIKKLCVWADEKLFPVVGMGEPTYVPMWWAFCVSFVGGLLIGVQSFFSSNPESRFPLIVMIVALLAVAAICVLYLLKDLKRFETVGMKVGRCAYLVFLVGVAFAVGFYLAMIVLMIVICLFVLWLCLGMIFGFDDDKKGNKKEVKLDDGTVLKVEKGVLGEEYYSDKYTGHSYEKNNDGTFSPK